VTVLATFELTRGCRNGDRAGPIEDWGRSTQVDGAAQSSRRQPALGRRPAPPVKDRAERTRRGIAPPDFRLRGKAAGSERPPAESRLTASGTLGPGFSRFRSVSPAMLPWRLGRRWRSKRTDRWKSKLSDHWRWNQFRILPAHVLGSEQPSAAI